MEAEQVDPERAAVRRGAGGRGPPSKRGKVGSRLLGKPFIPKLYWSRAASQSRSNRLPEGDRGRLVQGDPPARPVLRVLRDQPELDPACSLTALMTSGSGRSSKSRVTSVGLVSKAPSILLTRAMARVRISRSRESRRRAECGHRPPSDALEFAGRRLAVRIFRRAQAGHQRRRVGRGDLSQEDDQREVRSEHAQLSREDHPWRGRPLLPSPDRDRARITPRSDIISHRSADSTGRPRNQDDCKVASGPTPSPHPGPPPQGGREKEGQGTQGFPTPSPLCGGGPGWGVPGLAARLRNPPGSGRRGGGGRRSAC